MRSLDRLSRCTPLTVGASIEFPRKRSLAERGNALRQQRGASKDEPNAAHTRPVPYAPRIVAKRRTDRPARKADRHIKRVGAAHRGTPNRQVARHVRDMRALQAEIEQDHADDEPADARAFA